ncbi:MAG TPA: asparagine synthase (glutamine-hydrolyzing) [Polyangiaceae bacterium]|jgi:asparagine synthase (glutamine-hydrolysing)|nr:asparagine synthase (glutamine-hydrolyzing) [Polyangiaceae bacterium]
MCGIAGSIALDEGKGPPSLTTLRRMAGAIFHRGPDEQGLYRDARAGLAHTRLSIVDLASGQQPMRSVDGRGVIVFNGEIFNYVELRQELEREGHRFATKSDTEVALVAWLAWGEACFAKMNGQWAIAIWEPERKRLVLSRDRVGVRPLHFARHGGRLWFASEVKAIFAGCPEMPRALDPLGLDETFTFWASLAPRTPFVGVEELEPGGLLVIDLREGTERRARLWEPLYPARAEDGFQGSLDDAVEEVRALLAEATRLRMVRADVPVGSYLSGGLDSSLVASLGVHHQGETFHTFSLRFEDAEYDETEFQRAMVRRIGSVHHEVVVKRSDIAAAMPAVVRHTERPILRTAPAPLYYLSRLVHETGIKVVLTGEGADETFAGYDIFREGKVRRFWAKHPKSKSRPMLLDRLYPYLARSPVSQRAIAMQFFGRNLEHARTPGFAHEPRWQAASALKRLFSPEMHEAARGRDATAELLASLPRELASWPALSQDQHLEIRTLLSGYILSSQGDRMLMANAVEGRFPFLDARVLELSSRLPPSYKLKVLDEKHVLKRAAAPFIEASILARKKQPYRAPDALSFVGDSMPEDVRSALRPEAIEAAGVFAPGPVAHLLEKVRRATGATQFSNADNMAFVGVLTTQLLHQELVVRPPSPREVTPATVLDALDRAD